jgi:2-oxoglutarate ferredoxin oxidoreductase subunit alpha
VLGVPLARLCNENFKGVRTRILMKNICYAGALAALLDMDMHVIRALLAETYAKKPACSIRTCWRSSSATTTRSSISAVRCRCAREDGQDARPHHDRRQHRGRRSGCVYAGATVRLVPDHAVDLADGRVQELRRQAAQGSGNRQANFAFIQAEDELSAIGMVLGAGWNGARAFTATSGPGISLMSEFLGLAYYTEIPAVLFDVQRVAPPPACRRARSSAT